MLMNIPWDLFSPKIESTISLIKQYLIDRRSVRMSEEQRSDLSATTEDASREDYQSRDSPGDIEIPNRIFVKGFTKDATEDELKAFFEIYGIVHEAKIVYDKTGMSKGYAFISFDRQEIAEKVKEMGKVMCKGREIIIGPAKIRKRRPVSGYRHYGEILPPYTPPTYISPDGVWYYHVSPSPLLTIPFHYQMETTGGCTPPNNPQPSPPAAPAAGNTKEQESSTDQNISHILTAAPVVTAIPVTTTPAITTSIAIPTTHHANIIPELPKRRLSGPFQVPLPPVTSAVVSSPVASEKTHGNVLYTSPLQCIPIQYDSRFIEEATETLHTNIVYVDASKIRQVVMSDLPKHILV